MIRMNYGVSYLTNTPGYFQVKESINSSFFFAFATTGFLIIFYALQMTVLVSPVSPVTTLGIIQCGHQELIFSSFIHLPLLLKTDVLLSLPSQCFF